MTTNDSDDILGANEPLTCASSTNNRMSKIAFAGKVRRIKM